MYDMYISTFPTCSVVLDFLGCRKFFSAPLPVYAPPNDQTPVTLYTVFT